MKWIKPDLFKYVLDFENQHKRLPKIFLSGAITSRLDSYQEAFKEAELFFRELGMECYNPSVISIDTSWEESMEITLEELLKCDAIFILKDWEESRGVQEEITVAENHKIPIFYE